MSRNAAKDKKTLLEFLSESGIVQLACSKAGVPRATYYRWREEDELFRKAAQKAIETGDEVINDMAVSMHVKNIQAGNQKATEFQLRNRHPGYSNISESRLDKKYKIENAKLREEIAYRDRMDGATEALDLLDEEDKIRRQSETPQEAEVRRQLEEIFNKRSAQ